MNKSGLIFLITIMFSNICLCMSQPQCDLEGSWLIKSGRIFKNYEMANPYNSNKIFFSKDSVELASGFFYNTIDLSDDYPVGRYPFMYYGNKEKFKTSNDSVYIYSTPYKSWKSYKINCLSEKKILLVGKYDSLLLMRDKIKNNNRDCSIKYIKAHSFGGSLDMFKINYKVTYSKDDKLIFEDFDSLNNSFKPHNFKLRTGTFEKICDGFNNINLLELKKIYPTEASEISTIKLEFGLENGKIVKSEIQNKNCPEELRLAIIPILYMHQQFIYPQLLPKK